MAIMAYIGIPGSGKSYEVVSSVILEHFKQGRRIVTNIEGITQDKLISYINKYCNKLDKSNLGELISVTDEQCQQADFFPYKGSVNTICKAGDLICLDEIWRIFPTDKINDNHRSFVAEHRHFTHEETGICCDLVVINQSITGIPRFIKDRIETTFVMSRLVALGLSKRYRVNVYSGAKTTKNMLITQYQKKYDVRIFELYKSFDGVNGKTKSIDDRQNYFKSPQFKFSVFLIFVFFGFSYYLLSPYFFDNDNKTDSSVQNDRSSVIKNQISNNVNLKQKIDKTVDPKELISLEKQRFEEVPQLISQNWRITGELKRGGVDYVVLVDLKGNLRLEPRYFFRGQGRALTGILGGEVVSYYSGVRDEKFSKMGVQ